MTPTRDLVGVADAVEAHVAVGAEQLRSSSGPARRCRTPAGRPGRGRAHSRYSRRGSSVMRRWPRRPTAALEQQAGVQARDRQRRAAASVSWPGATSSERVLRACERHGGPQEVSGAFDSRAPLAARHRRASPATPVVALETGWPRCRSRTSAAVHRGSRQLPSRVQPRGTPCRGDRSGGSSWSRVWKLRASSPRRPVGSPVGELQQRAAGRRCSRRRRPGRNPRSTARR